MTNALGKTVTSKAERRELARYAHLCVNIHQQQFWEKNKKKKKEYRDKEHDNIDVRYCMECRQNEEKIGVSRV